MFPFITSRIKLKKEKLFACPFMRAWNNETFGVGSGVWFLNGLNSQREPKFHDTLTIAVGSCSFDL